MTKLSAEPQPAKSQARRDVEELVDRHGLASVLMACAKLIADDGDRQPSRVFRSAVSAVGHFAHARKLFELSDWAGRHDLRIRLDADELEAVQYYAATNGPSWRSRLRQAWTRGEEMTDALQRLRNTLGPSGLDIVPSTSPNPPRRRNLGQAAV